MRIGMVADGVPAGGDSPRNSGEAPHVRTDHEERGRHAVARQGLENRSSRLRVGTVVEGEIHPTVARPAPRDRTEEGIVGLERAVEGSRRAAGRQPQRGSDHPMTRR